MGGTRPGGWDFSINFHAGDGIVGGKPVTLVVTADDLRPWRRHAGRVACLANRRLIVLGDWRAVEDSKERVVQELLAE